MEKLLVKGRSHAHKLTLTLAYFLSLFYICFNQYSPALAQPCIQPPPGMVSWWPGDGNMDDIAGGRHGTPVNGASFAPGKVDQAFSFGGNYVSVADEPFWTLGDNPFTIDLWVNFNPNQGRAPFVSHDERGNEFNKWIFWYDPQGHDKPSGPALRFHINSPTLPPLDPVYAPWSPTPEQWYHVAVTRSGSAYALYIDGAQVATGTDHNTIPDPDVPLMIGRAEAYYFNGLIDEVEIYNRALSQSEIQAIFNAGSAGKCKEDCSNGIDDDGDGLVDCEDPDCCDQPGCDTCECEDTTYARKLSYIKFSKRALKDKASMRICINDDFCAAMQAGPDKVVLNVNDCKNIEIAGDELESNSTKTKFLAVSSTHNLKIDCGGGWLYLRLRNMDLDDCDTNPVKFCVTIVKAGEDDLCLCAEAQFTEQYDRKGRLKKLSFMVNEFCSP